MRDDSGVLEARDIEEKAHGLAFPTFLTLKPTTKAVALREARRTGSDVFRATSAALGGIANVTQGFGPQWLSNGAATLRDKALAYSEYCLLEKQKIRLFEAIVEKQRSQWGKEINVWDHWQQLESYAQQNRYLGNREHISQQEGQFKHNPNFSCPEIMLEGAARRASVTPPAEVEEHKENSAEHKAAYGDRQDSSESESLLEPQAGKAILFMGQSQTSPSSSSSSFNSELPTPPINTDNNSKSASAPSVVHRGPNPLRRQ